MDNPYYIKSFVTKKKCYFFPRIIGSDVITKNFEIDKRSGHISIAKGSSLDVNHLNGENLFFGVEVSEPQI